MKKSWGTCGTFKVINLTYLHVLHAGLAFIYAIALAIAHTKVPLSSACIWTLFHLLPR